MGMSEDSMILQMLLDIVGTIALVHIIIHKWLKMSYAQGILASCCSLVKVNISRTLRVLVVFGCMRVLSISLNI